MELTRCEMEIMDVLWDAGEPLSRGDLLDRSEGKRWKDSSIHILLNGMLRKEAISESGFVRRSKTYGRLFAPTMTREEYYAQTCFCHSCKPQVVGLFKALIARPEVTDEDLKQLRSLLDNAE